jgi:GTP pyrophosphokinase
MACARPALSGFAARHAAGARRCGVADSRVHSHASAGARTTSASSRAPTRRFARAASRPAESSPRGARVASRAAVDQVAGAADWSHVDPDYLYNSIADKLTYLNDFERSEVYAATEIAFHAHDGQRRKSGEPFVTHPVAVAGILADQHMDHETVIAGLLHDTVEDTDAVTFESIHDRFGPAVRRIVEGETKVSKVSSSVSKQGAELTPDEAKAAAANVQADDLQQMFLAMTTEVRVIIVKLADRLHNMRTLGSLKPEKRVKISRETLLVFAPLAKLLGMYEVKNELEALAFRWSAPEYHAETARWFDELSVRQEPVVRRATAELRRRLEEDEYLRAVCAKVDVTPRAKELYGLYRKAGGEKLGAIGAGSLVPAGSSSSSSSKNGAGKNGKNGSAGKNGDGAAAVDVSHRAFVSSLRQVSEVAQLRVVLRLRDDAYLENGGVHAVSSRVCYHVLGAVHAMWPPVPGRMKDYVATPKLNGYRALHTVVLPIGSDQGSPGPEGQGRVTENEVFPLELQIRTESMHRMAEHGIAADPEVKAAWRSTARRTGKRLRRKRREAAAAAAEAAAEGCELAADAVPLCDFRSVDDGESSDESDEEDDEEDDDLEDSVLTRSGHARQVAWLSNIREWQEEFLGVLTAEEFVDTITGDLLGRRVFVFTPSGGVMNLPHGSTAVDYAFYTDTGLDMVEAKVNGVSVDFDVALKNADVVEIVTRETSGVELLGGAGEASASAVANLVAKSKIALQREFLGMARTRSARAKIKKFLADAGASISEDEDDDAVVAIADLDVMPSSDVDVIDATEATAELRVAAENLVREATRAGAEVGRATRRYSVSTVWLRCADKDGLLREISAVISEIGGCSIVGYAGESLGDGEFVMTYTFAMDSRGVLAAAAERGGEDPEAATKNARRALAEFDGRLAALFRELRRNPSVLEAKLFCKTGTRESPF